MVDARWRCVWRTAAPHTSHTWPRLGSALGGRPRRLPQTGRWRPCQPGAARHATAHHHSAFTCHAATSFTAVTCAPCTNHSARRAGLSNDERACRGSVVDHGGSPILASTARLTCSVLLTTNHAFLSPDSTSPGISASDTLHPLCKPTLSRLPQTRCICIAFMTSARNDGAARIVLHRINNRFDTGI